MSVMKVKVASPRLKSRVNVIEDQFALFLTVSGVSDEERKSLLSAVRAQEIEAVGLYLADDTGLRVAEIELGADWKLHEQMILTYSDTMDMSKPHFTSEGYAVEPYVAAVSLKELAEECGLRISLWIRVTTTLPAQARDEISSRLGYTRPVPEWKSAPAELSRRTVALRELTVTNRQI